LTGRHGSRRIRRVLAAFCFWSDERWPIFISDRRVAGHHRRRRDVRHRAPGGPRHRATSPGRGGRSAASARLGGLRHAVSVAGLRPGRGRGHGGRGCAGESGEWLRPHPGLLLRRRASGRGGGRGDHGQPQSAPVQRSQVQGGLRRVRPGLVHTACGGGDPANQCRNGPAGSRQQAAGSDRFF